MRLRDQFLHRLAQGWVMNWSIHGVSLLAHDLAASAAFSGSLLGLGVPSAVGPDAVAFGVDGCGLRLNRPGRHLLQPAPGLPTPAGGRHLILNVSDLNAVVGRLDRAAIPHRPAAAGLTEAPAVCTTDPGLNVIVFRQGEETRHGPDWHIHHVNLEVPDVREAAAFYTEIAGMAEGQWRAPVTRGDFSIDPASLAVLPLGDGNSGLHLIRADPSFALRNGFAHIPSIGGHPAFCVRDVLAVKRRLLAAGHVVSDAGVYAMAGMHQIYVFDPSTNMIEVNQVV